MRRRNDKGYVQHLEEGAWAIAISFLVVGGALGFFVAICIAHVANWGDGAWCR